MASVAFTGNLGKVQQLKFSNDGKARLSFSVGESTREKQADGSWGNSASTWWNVTVFGFQAEDLADALQEGAKQKVTVAGRSKTREYQKQDGTTASSLDVIADFVGIVPAKSSGQQSGRLPEHQTPDQVWSTQANSAGWGTADPSDPPF